MVQKASILSQAVADLSRRDPVSALQRLQPWLDGGHDDPDAHLVAAFACALQGDDPAALHHVGRCLESQPQHVRALILKADVLLRMAEVTAAMTFYAAALKVAEGQSLSGAAADEVRRAQGLVDHYQSVMAQRLEGRLTALQSRSGQRSHRFDQALDILLGRRAIYQQQPRQFFFPELPQIQFHDRAQFAWLPALDAATDAIRGELMALLADAGAFKPYVERDASRPNLNDGGMLGNDDWCAFYLWKSGVEVVENTRRCPATMRALAEVPLARVPGRSPTVLFSLMKPGAHIPAHHGFVNTRLIGHLPLIIPPGCFFRVGNEKRPWEEGKTWIFDDTIEHEAWNTSDRMRVVLLFDIWAPALQPHEREWVADMFRELDDEADFKLPAWDD